MGKSGIVGDFDALEAGDVVVDASGATVDRLDCSSTCLLEEL